jgi:hypothetical protein
MAAKKARVLVGFSDGEKSYAVNQVAAFEDGPLKAYKAAGQIDDHPAAVAYAEKLAAKAKARAELDAEG